ncbi:RTA1 like protein-domain-containing protein [Mycena metata]|uniref:RTA1 like protein-domain-containing protein n=1 Tax=Mycena metata TaxID=1033252 RepID=A0AAD7K467_9AGAR|nr:RTA1 like protein-domain-containing protein [Mycena metata]
MVHDPRPNPQADDDFFYCPSIPVAALICWVLIAGGLWATGGLLLRAVSVFNTTSSEFGTPARLLIFLFPLCITSFLYVLMARLVYFFVPEKHVLGISAPRLGRCFVLLDSTAFLMQAGGDSFINGDHPKLALLGMHLYIGGIGLQQLCVLWFTALVIRFHYKLNRLDGSTAWKRPLRFSSRQVGPQICPFQRNDWIIAQIRIIFRLVKFSAGVFSPIAIQELPFYCLEVVPMFATVLLWNIFHPGQVFIGSDGEFPERKENFRQGALVTKEQVVYDLVGGAGTLPDCAYTETRKRPGGHWV